MRKTLIQLLLICMIVSCLSSGTLAVYTTSIELDPVTVTAKRFYIGVGSAGNFDILLAPGEESYNEFTVTNVDAKEMATEVDMSLLITGDFSELYQTIPGISVSLVEVGNGNRTVSVDESGLLNFYEALAFHADQYETRTFRLVFSWKDLPEDGSQALLAGKHVNGITLYITGTQSLS